jgi:YesN/AraC family two-component response regulator
MDGMCVVKQVRERQPDTEAIIITGYPTVASAVESSKIGVFDYLRKPFSEDDLKKSIQGALKRKETVSIEEILVETEKDRLIQKQEVLRVLNKTVADSNFWQALMQNGSAALKGYHLSLEAKAAIVSGDLKWIKKHVGELTPEQLHYIYKRLEREVW